VTAPPHLKPTHKALRAYYDALAAYAAQGAVHEGATETAFSRLLADTAPAVGWTLVPKQPLKAGGRTIIPDGTLRDICNLPRGYWEAKDTDDDLDVEIRKKIGKKYPLSNAIFEDTRRAVLYQNGTETRRYDLAAPQQLADLLNGFYKYAEPDIEGFEEAVTEFQERVPELAKGLGRRGAASAPCMPAGMPCNAWMRDAVTKLRQGTWRKALRCCIFLLCARCGPCRRHEITVSSV